MKKWHKYLALCICLLALFGTFFCLAESFIERFRAEELLHIFADLQIGATQTPRLDAQLDRFKRYQSSKGSFGGRSYEQFMFWNYGFALFHLAPAKQIWIQIDYENGRVVEKIAHFAEAPNRGAVVTEEADIERPPFSSDPLASAIRKVTERGTYREPTYMLSVRDNISVPANRRRMDWMIDLKCMTRLGPCGDFRKVLRGAFE